MKPIVWILPICLVLGACDRSKKDTLVSPVATPLRIDEMQGKKLDVLIQTFGLPDYMAPREFYQVKADGIEDTIGLSYKTLGRDIFVSHDCTILHIFYSKEFIMDPKNSKFIEQMNDQETSADASAPSTQK